LFSVLLCACASLLYDHRLLTAQDRAGASHGSHLEVLSIVSVEERSSDRLERLARISFQLDARVVLRRFPQTGSVSGDEHDPLAARRRLNADRFLLHETAVTERVTSLQIVRLLRERRHMLVLHEEARVVANDKPLNIGRHLGSCSTPEVN